MPADQYRALDLGLRLSSELPALGAFHRSCRGWLEDMALKRGLNEATTAFCEEHAASLSNSLVLDGGVPDFVAAILGAKAARGDWGACAEDWGVYLETRGMPQSVFDRWQATDNQIGNHIGLSRIALQELCGILKLDPREIVTDLGKVAELCGTAMQSA